MDSPNTQLNDIITVAKLRLEVTIHPFSIPASSQGMYCIYVQHTYSIYTVYIYMSPSFDEV